MNSTQTLPLTGVTVSRSGRTIENGIRQSTPLGYPFGPLTLSDYQALIGRVHDTLARWACTSLVQGDDTGGHALAVTACQYADENEAAWDLWVIANR